MKIAIKTVRVLFLGIAVLFGFIALHAADVSAAGTEPIYILKSVDGARYPIPQGAIKNPFRKGKPLSVVLQAMAASEMGSEAGEQGVLPIEANSGIVQKIRRILAGFYAAKQAGELVDDDAIYNRLINNERNAIFNALGSNEARRALLFELCRLADYLDSDVLGSIVMPVAREYFLAPATIENFLANPGAYLRIAGLQSLIVPAAVGIGSYYLVQRLEGLGGKVWSIAYSPEGNQFASGLNDGTIKLWNREADGSVGLFQTLEAHEDNVRSVAYAPGGNQLASGSVDGTIKLWNKQLDGNFVLFQTLEGQGSVVFSLAYSPDGNQLASGLVGGIKLWNKGIDGRFVLQQTFKEENALSLSYSPDGSRLASVIGKYYWYIQIWAKKADGEFVYVQTIETSMHRSISYSPDGNQIVGGGQQAIRIWKRGDRGFAINEGLRTLFWLESLTFSPDGSQLAAGGTGTPSIQIWKRGADGKFVQVQALRSGLVHSLAYSRDGNYLAVGLDDGIIELWQQNVVISILQAMFITALKQVGHFDLSAPTDANQALREIALSLTGLPAAMASVKEFVCKRVDPATAAAMHCADGEVAAPRSAAAPKKRSGSESEK